MSLDQLIDSTMATLQPYSQDMPSFDKKYFSRPPIKFIALTVKAIQKKTGFGGDYFSEAQLTGNLPARDDKIGFFDTLKEYTQLLIKQSIDVESKSIAAGKDVEKTLMFLQSIVQGATNPAIPFDHAAAILRGEPVPSAAPAQPAKKEKPTEKKKPEPAPAPAPEKKPDPVPEKKPDPVPEKKPEPVPEKKVKPAPAPEPTPEPVPEKKAKPAPEPVPEPVPEKKPKVRIENKPEPVVPTIKIDNVEDVTEQFAGRPMTARKAPPKIKEEASVVVESVAPQIIREADIDDDVDDIFVEEDTQGQVSVVSGAESGKLVKDILEACREMGPTSETMSNANEPDRFKQGIELAKGLLQHLARSAQPLDTLIQFSQEDLGNMENEYKRWTSECEKRQKALDSEKLITEQQLNELMSKVDDLDKEIVRQESRLRSIKASAFLKEADLMKQFTTMCGH